MNGVSLLSVYLHSPEEEETDKHAFADPGEARMSEHTRCVQTRTPQASRELF